jgi:hypothetical protein
MADIIDKGYATSSNSSTIPQKFRDLGDGTYALEILGLILDELRLQTPYIQATAPAVSFSLIPPVVDLTFTKSAPTVV